MSAKWLLTTATGAVLGAVVIYQLRKRTTGIVDD
jgi:hypothetical protein